MTDVELLTEQIEAVRSDIVALSAAGPEMVNHRDLAALRDSLARLLKARREAQEWQDGASYRSWVRDRERELIGRGWVASYGRPEGEA